MLTPNMLRVLREISQGLGAYHGLTTINQYAGRSRTVYSLQKRRLIDHNRTLTLRGRDVLEGKPG